jgi:hypothetical protein
MTPARQRDDVDGPARWQVLRIEVCMERGRRVGRQRKPRLEVFQTNAQPAVPPRANASVVSDSQGA